MAYREKLLELDSSTASYVVEICHRDRNSMNQQILRLYGLWKEHGTERFLEAVHFCNESRVYGWEYVELTLRIPEDEGLDEDSESESRNCIAFDQPEQSEIDRDLAIYDTYSHR